MTLVFFPGRRHRFKKLYTYNIYSEVQACNCIQEPVGKLKYGYKDSTQTENGRISQILSNNLGGRTTFGNFGNPVPINYLGRQEGHQGGSLAPLRNKF